MGWVYEKFVLPSEKNGQICGTRFFGSWEIVGDKFFQTSSYVTRMWQKAIRRVPPEGMHRILVLGLGGGGCIAPLRKRFPKAQIVAIEWDQAMVKTADRIKVYGQRPDITVGDAQQLITKLEGNFDLIIGDIFQGAKPSSAFFQTEFMSQVARLLGRDGYFILNAYRTPEIFETARQAMGLHATWRFRQNRLALYRPLGCGASGDPVPQGYRHYLSSFPYLARQTQSGPKELVGTLETPGLRWHYGPFWIESYQSDVEPRIQPFGKLRFVIWQRVARLDKPRGWLWFPSQMNHQKTGYAMVQAEYWKTWSGHAQRHRRNWLGQKDNRIRGVGLEEYLKNYAQARQDPILKNLTSRLMRKKVAAQGARCRFFLAQDASGGTLAGLCVVEVPEQAYAYHLNSFVLRSGEKKSAAVGLIDFWFREALERHIRFLDFDNFWAPGDPRDWRGFSRFKAQFGTRFILYPKPLVRFVRGSKDSG